MREWYAKPFPALEEVGVPEVAADAQMAELKKVKGAHTRIHRNMRTHTQMHTHNRPHTHTHRERKG
jgi:hypothetical protein